MLKSILSFLGDFFAKVARTFIGKAVEEMAEASQAIVRKVEENPALTGKEKFNQAKKMLQNRYPSAESAALNLAIETAVALLKEEGKNGKNLSK